MTRVFINLNLSEDLVVDSRLVMKFLSQEGWVEIGFVSMKKLKKETRPLVVRMQENINLNKRDGFESQSRKSACILYFTQLRRQKSIGRYVLIFDLSQLTGVYIYLINILFGQKRKYIIFFNTHTLERLELYICIPKNFYMK